MGEAIVTVDSDMLLAWLDEWDGNLFRQLPKDESIPVEIEAQSRGMWTYFKLTWEED